MVDVFISYSREDLGAVKRLAEAVEAAGYDVWWDADLPPHLSYGDVITAKIGMAKAAIVVWSQASASSQWVRAEADMARNQAKLVQTSLDNVMPPLPFNQIQFAELGDWQGEPDHLGWRKVKASLTELCGREVAPEPRYARTPAAASRPMAPAAPKWPLFAGIGVGVLALAAAAWLVLSERARQPLPAPTPAPVAQEVQATSIPGPAAPEATDAPARAAEISPPANPMPIPAALEGMVFPYSSERLLTPGDIDGLGREALEIARNEIFARKGRRFARADLRDYFLQFDWYRPVADEVSLNGIEQQNVERLRQAETRFGR